MPHKALFAIQIIFSIFVVNIALAQAPTDKISIEPGAISNSHQTANSEVVILPSDVATDGLLDTGPSPDNSNKVILSTTPGNNGPISNGLIKKLPKTGAEQ